MRMVMLRIQKRGKPKNQLLEARRVRISQRKSCVMTGADVRSEGFMAAVAISHVSIVRPG
jgi:hypothetical protein